jgi:cyclase
VVKKRLIFSFLISGNSFVLSRNFRLQRVGDIDWIKKNFKLQDIFRSIDELIILNVTRGMCNIDGLCDAIKELSKQCFVPIAAGGGIRSIADAEKILEAGADKLIVNTAIFKNQPLVENLTQMYGTASMVGSIDFIKSPDGNCSVHTDSGSQSTGYDLGSAIALADALKLGELYVSSIDRDGTGMGFDYEAISLATKSSNTPIIASGGAGNFEHILKCFTECKVNAVSTANLFNFMGRGLIETRINLIKEGCDIADWSKC